ncbi:MAG: flavin reductase family protein [Gammaproteobacteria bacterium]|nr:flavin reductase family protein [Gammaproteobacteria bacterium]MDH3410254.1 flavin reductase family protein [Gammaproteobacteria bacterium]
MPLELRQSLSRFATGVTIVTCQGSEGPCGITANSFSSVSLEPPLVLWNIAKVSNSLQAYLDAEYFAINVLNAEQQSLSAHFALSDHTLFAGIEFELSDRGVPIFPGTIACFECRTRAVLECGDHYIIIGEVEKHCSNGGRPLLFSDGQYGTVADSTD